jgi:cephalosporin-C deacetylase
MQRISTTLIVSILCLQVIFAQSQQGQLIRIMVSPSRADMVYSTGEEVNFEIAVYQFGHLLQNASIEYRIGPEKMDPVVTKKITLPEGKISLSGGSMKEPGFLTCQVFVEKDGQTYMNSGTAAIDPEKIQPTTDLPADFGSFWEENLQKLKEVALEPEITLMPERCTHYTNVYHVKIRNIQGFVYGILTVPKAGGKYPAILHVPGAGVRSYQGDISDRPVISLTIGIHGIPVNMYDSDLYTDLGSGLLQGYWVSNLDDRDKYYFRRVYLGCVRAVDFIHSLPEFDGEHLGVMGGSQGGALSIITTGLDERIDYLVSFYPALSDLTGYLKGRAGGWPHMFRDEFTNTEKKIQTSKYYDVVNFARNVKVPGYYSFGFNDNVCPPTSIYSALNVIEGPKETVLYHDAAHWQYPEQSTDAKKWMYEKLGVE